MRHNENNLIALLKQLDIFVLCIAILITLCQCSKGSTIDIPISKLENGDIAFRRGIGINSRAVIHCDNNGKYSHIGVVVKQDNSVMVIHAVPGEHDSEDDFDRIKIEPINHFFRKEAAQSGEILRYPLSETQKYMIASFAKHKANEKIKFDHDYDLNDTSALYCTEFIQLIFANHGIDLSEGRRTSLNIPGMNGEYLMPSDIYKNKLLKTIFYY